MLKKSTVEHVLEDLIAANKAYLGKRGHGSEEYVKGKIAALDEALEIIRKLPTIRPV